MMNVMFIRDTIYRLQQDYGQCMDLYVPLKTIQNYETGVQSTSLKRIRIRRVVLLTEVLQRRFVHDVALLTAGRNFAYGGLFDEAVRNIIVAGHDVPKGIKMDDSCYFIYKHIRYDVVKVEELEHRCGYVLSMKDVNTRLPYEIMELRVGNSIQWTGVPING